MEREQLRLVELWNGFMGNLVSARDAWEEINGIMLNERPVVEDWPIAAQKVLTSFGKSRFSVAVPRMLDWARSYTGMEFEHLLVPIEEPEVEEEFEEEFEEEIGSEIFEEQEEVVDER